jgi:hypothetical protein
VRCLPSFFRRRKRARASNLDVGAKAAASEEFVPYPGMSSSYFFRSYEERFCLACGLDDYLETNYNINGLWDEPEYAQSLLGGGEHVAEEEVTTKSFLEGLPERDKIWPLIVETGNTLMVVLKSVCRSWAD